MPGNTPHQNVQIAKALSNGRAPELARTVTGVLPDNTTFQRVFQSESNMTWWLAQYGNANEVSNVR